MRFRFLFTSALGWGAGLLSGCQGGSDALPPEPVLYPVTGKVTVQGKPLAQAVVTFLQVDEKGTTSVGETDDEGNFDLAYGGVPGAAAAKYKVAISYIMGTDGTVYGLGPRSGLAKPYGLITGKELLLPEWSNLGKTTQRVEVPERGGTSTSTSRRACSPHPSPKRPSLAMGAGKPPHPRTRRPSRPPPKERTRRRRLRRARKRRRIRRHPPSRRPPDQQTPFERKRSALSGRRPSGPIA